jgi:hypothetical protein
LKRIGGQGPNRTADAGLFTAAYRMGPWNQRIIEDQEFMSRGL